jgi:hypothetical protein
MTFRDDFFLLSKKNFQQQQHNTFFHSFFRLPSFSLYIGGWQQTDHGGRIDYG